MTTHIFTQDSVVNFEVKRIKYCKLNNSLKIKGELTVEKKVFVYSVNYEDLSNTFSDDFLPIFTSYNEIGVGIFSYPKLYFKYYDNDSLFPIQTPILEINPSSVCDSINNCKIINRKFKNFIIVNNL